MLRIVASAIPLTIGFAAGSVCPVKQEKVASYVPPGWVFGAMWTVIYVLLGALIYTLPESTSWVVWAALAANLVFNLSWTAVYARSCADRPDLALFWILGSKATLAALVVLLLPTPKFILYLVVYWVWLDAALILNWGALSSRSG